MRVLGHNVLSRTEKPKIFKIWNSTFSKVKVKVPVSDRFNLSGQFKDPRFRPEMLVDEDLIVVTINYRLGALGFLSTDTPRCQRSGRNM